MSVLTHARDVNGDKGTGVTNTALTTFVPVHWVLNMREEQQTTKATTGTHSTISLLCIHSVCLQLAKNQPFIPFACSVFWKMFLLY